MDDRQRGSSAARRRESWNLFLATFTFGVAFAAWGLIAPLARQFQDDWGLSSTETAVLIAVPVILGSLLRIPVGALTDRFGGRKMFVVVLLLCAPPFILLGYVETYPALLVTGLLLGVAGSSFAVGVPFRGRLVRGLATGVRGRRLRRWQHRHRRGHDRHPARPLRLPGDGEPLVPRHLRARSEWAA